MSMTTKQTTDRSVRDTDGPVVESDVDESQQAEDASRQLLAKARYDAFRLMTEARNEAETILDEAIAEADGTKNAARLIAASTTEKAGLDAAAIVESAREEAAAIVAGAHRTAGERRPLEDEHQLEVEHEALSERVSTLRTLADQLEDRFAALAAMAGETSEPHQDAGAPDVGSPALDHSATVAPQDRPTDSQTAEVTEDRGSFYHRRSANLPSLGEDGGRSALQMTRMMRESLEGE
jgi:cell division septum initiation protein DivIVA